MHCWRAGFKGREPLNSYLGAILPITRLPLAMRNRHDGDYIGVVKVDDREREALYDEASRSVEVFRPSLLRLCSEANRTRYSYAKFRRYQEIFGAVPTNGVSKFFLRFWMKSKRLTLHPGTL